MCNSVPPYRGSNKVCRVQQTMPELMIELATVTNLSFRPRQDKNISLRVGQGRLQDPGPENQPEDGVVLHQPLNRPIFRNFGKKDPNLNGIPVCQTQKTQNAPTWQVENTARRRPILRIFWSFSDLFLLIRIMPYNRPSVYLFLLLN